MRRDWRSNIWMVIELVISGVALWIIMAFLCFMGDRYATRKGYDTTDVYAASIQCIGNQNPNFIPRDSVAVPDADLRRLVEQLRTNPYVDAVGVGLNATPYKYNYYGCHIVAPEADSMIMYEGNMRIMSPEAFRILGIEGLDGTDTERLAAMLERGELIVSNFDSQFSESLPAELFDGKDVYLNADTTRTLHVGALAYGVRRNDFEPLFSGIVYKPMPDNWTSADEVIIKVKPGQGREFVESLTTSDLRMGNVYLTDLQSLADRAFTAHTAFRSMMTNMSIFAGFLMLVIFLGFLGTFWFRTYQRVGEIAMRKVCGATDSQIFRRMITEGLLLLAVALPLIAVIEYMLFESVIKQIISGIEVSPLGLWGGSVSTVTLMAAVIVAAIWFPARKAMQTDPATALKDL